MPDIPIATVFLYAVDDFFDGINLVWAHYQQLLFAGNKYHITTDDFAKFTLGKEILSKGDQTCYGDVIFPCPVIYRKESLFGIKIKMLVVVVRKVVGVGHVAYNEQLNIAKQGVRVAIASVTLIVNNLLDSSTRTYVKRFELHLNNRESVY